MTVGYRSSASVTNGTAGTSVVVTKPAGTADGDVLVAFVAEVGTGSITAPAGWTLIETHAAATSVTQAAYYKVAASEGGSWTWTLGASVRNWGWVGAYTGVDTASIVADTANSEYTTTETQFEGAFLRAPTGGRSVCGVAAVRAASGSATTWTHTADAWSVTATERADVGTNGGAGTDITGTVGETVNTGTGATSFLSGAATASQSQTHACVLLVALRPAMTTYAGGLLSPTVEAAFGADPNGDPDAWTWTDITAYVRQEPGVTISKGRDGWFSSTTPAQMSFLLANPAGRFTPGHPTGAYYPNVRLSTPVRARVPYGRDAPTNRVVAFVDSWAPGWDLSTNDPVVAVTASGRVRRLAGSGLRSAAWRYQQGLSYTASTPAAYWPCEDAAGATQAAAAAGPNPMQVTGGVTFAAASDLTGSGALPTIETGGGLHGVIADYAATGRWAVALAAKIPAAPAGTCTLLTVTATGGTARTWQLRLIPGSPDALQIRILNGSGTELVADTGDLVEAAVYGHWVVFWMAAEQSGSDTLYSAGMNNGSSGTYITPATLSGYSPGTVRDVDVTVTADLTGLAVGHVTAYSDTDYDPTLAIPGFARAACTGNSDEDPGTRFPRLCDEEGVPYTTVDGLLGLTIRMGPQPATTLTDALLEIETTDQGIIHDGGYRGDIVRVHRASLYNQTPAITLDQSSGELAAPFAPVFDDQAVRTVSTVTRSGGSSATYTGDTTDGVYRDDLVVNTYDDTPLPHLAAWRVHLGEPATRYPAVTIDLRRSPALTEAWLESVRIGKRLTATDLMSEHGPDDVDIIITGWTERLSATGWSASIVGTPARPYTVAVVEGSGDSLWRLDSDSSTLTSDINSSATSASVTVGTLPLWSTTAAPFDLDIGGERVTATAISGASSPQTFTVTRSVNGVVKAHSAGAAVSLWHPAVIVL